MNSVVLIAFIAAPGYLLAAVLAFVLSRQGRDRAASEAKLRTQCDDALLQLAEANRKVAHYHAESITMREKRAADAVDLNEEIKALSARNTGLSDALEKTRVLYNNILAQNKALQAKPRQPKKAASE